MATLSSTSTLAEIQAAYYDSASYIEEGSASMARAFITACRLLLVELPKRANKGGDEIELDQRLIAEQIAEARRFITEANIQTGPPTHFSIENFRD